MFGTFVLHQYFHRCFTVGMQVRAALISACYEKAMKLTLTARTLKTSGEIMTMITVDVRKIRDVFPYLWMVMSGPFQIIVSIYLLYRQISWAVFVGVGVQIVIMVRFHPFLLWMVSSLYYMRLSICLVIDASPSHGGGARKEITETSHEN